MESVSLKTNVWVKKCHVIQHFSTFARALKSAKPPPKDSVPNTAANGSERPEEKPRSLFVENVKSWQLQPQGGAI